MRASVGVFKGITHSEFAHVKFAKQYRSSVVQLVYYGGIFFRNEALQDSGTAGGKYAFGIDLVFDCYWDAGIGPL